MNIDTCEALDPSSVGVSFDAAQADTPTDHVSALDLRRLRTEIGPRIVAIQTDTGSHEWKPLLGSHSSEASYGLWVGAVFDASQADVES